MCVVLLVRTSAKLDCFGTFDLRLRGAESPVLATFYEVEYFEELISCAHRISIIPTTKSSGLTKTFGGSSSSRIVVPLLFFALGGIPRPPSFARLSCAVRIAALPARV